MSNAQCKQRRHYPKRVLYQPQRERNTQSGDSNVSSFVDSSAQHCLVLCGLICTALSRPLWTHLHSTVSSFVDSSAQHCLVLCGLICTALSRPLWTHLHSTVSSFVDSSAQHRPLKVIYSLLFISYFLFKINFIIIIFTQKPFATT